MKASRAPPCHVREDHVMRCCSALLPCRKKFCPPLHSKGSSWARAFLVRLERTMRSPCRALLVLLLMRGAEVRKLLENVGVRFQTAGRAFAFGQEREAVLEHVVSEHAAVGILRGLRRIETQHVGQCSLLVDLGNRFFARVISRVTHQMYELIEPALAIVHGLAGVVFQLRVVGVEKAADTRMARAIDVDQLAILPHAASSPDVYFGLGG